MDGVEATPEATAAGQDPTLASESDPERGDSDRGALTVIDNLEDVIRARRQ